jgi:hypothetical protein
MRAACPRSRTDDEDHRCRLGSPRIAAIRPQQPSPPGLPKSIAVASLLPSTFFRSASPSACWRSSCPPTRHVKAPRWPRHPRFLDHAVLQARHLAPAPKAPSLHLHRATTEQLASAVEPAHSTTARPHRRRDACPLRPRRGAASSRLPFHVRASTGAEGAAYLAMPRRTVGRTSLPPAVCLSHHRAGV